MSALTPWRSVFGKDGLSAQASRLLRALPGGEYVERALDQMQQALLHELKQRLDHLEREQTRSRDGAIPLVPQAELSLPRLARRLQNRALEQSGDQARQEYYLSLMTSLLPDEVRILAALADGTAHALVHVTAGSVVGTNQRRVAENLSGIGKQAGVAWREGVPRYLTRLRDFGLVETGPEDASLSVQYDLIETDDQARKLTLRIEQRERQTVRFQRRIVRISELGASLWMACLPSPALARSEQELT